MSGYQLPNMLPEAKQQPKSSAAQLVRSVTAVLELNDINIDQHCCTCNEINIAVNNRQRGYSSRCINALVSMYHTRYTTAT